MKSRGRGSLDASPFFSTALPARKIVDFKPGQTIISQGDECTDVHYIDEGSGPVIVFFHGNDATLERDVIGRQHIPSQLASSGVNAALAAPQFAVGIRDSSPGKQRLEIS